MKVSRELFEKMAEDALAGVPRRFLKVLVNVEISVQARPGPEAGRWVGSKDLLGLYTGLTREEMLMTQAGSFAPARVVLYQANLEAGCATEAELRARVAVTLRHELAHHFGFSDEDLRKKWPEGA